MSSPTKNTKNIIFLTGASGKIGIKFLKILLDLGFNVVAHCSKNQKVITDFLYDNPKYGDFIEILQADFDTELDKVLEILVQRGKNLTGLINCAAIFEKGNLENPNSLLQTLKINNNIPVVLTAKFAEIVKSGFVINILDGNIYKFNKNYQNYRISKLFLEEITKQSAILFAPKVRVNAISLGMLDEYKIPSYISAKNKEILTANISDDEISRVISLLITGQSITGQIIYLDNGVHLL